MAYNNGDIAVMLVKMADDRSRKFEFKIEKVKGKRSLISLETDIYYIVHDSKERLGPLAEEELTEIIENHDGYVTSPPEPEEFDTPHWMF